MSAVSNFIDSIVSTFKTGVATEHSYRSAIEDLFNDYSEGIHALNEPKRVVCGAPDFIIQRGELVIGHIEAKDVGVGLRGMKDGNKRQQERYRQALPNLIYTNCLDWDFYRNGKLVASVTIAGYLKGIQPNPKEYAKLESLLADFVSQRPQSITSPRVLAGIMAGKARLIKDVLHNALKADENNETEFWNQYSAFKDHLIHDISIEDFADIYAETIAYGMFAARLHDTTDNTFSRQEALGLLPKSNPFLRNLFTYLAGYDLDDRIAWIIDDLATVFREANIAQIMEGFGKLSGQNDPFLHFYETFLAAYNPAKRKARGVWYTPEPVVNFIVRAVDTVLQTEFSLPDGLADTSRITIDWETGQTDKKGNRTKVKKDVHRVQVLDPATGTGTFLAEVIKQIAPKVKDNAPSMWSSYIEQDLIPRLHGFELLMASYAMCHMKLELILTELGYKPAGAPPRLSVYLTNSLEEGEPANQVLPFAQWLSNEVKQANTVKRDMPIMCLIGNPPYLGEGGKSEGWLGTLMDDYKKEPGGKAKLTEKTSKWLNDLYVKFIRLSSHLIERNGEGVLGFVTNHGYLDNPTFRGMRWHLLKSFDTIWILDLHGSTKKKESPPAGLSDKNVFDIQQGVSIIIGVKKRQSSDELAKVLHADLWGDRAEKYARLSTLSISDGIFKPLDCRAPQFSLTPISMAGLDRYSTGFLLDEFMPLHGNGIVTKRDALNIQRTAADVVKVAKDLVNLEERDFRTRYRLPADVRDWRYEWAKKDVKDHPGLPVQEINYRLFDRRFVFYSGRARGLIGWPVAQIMTHYVRGPNIGLLTSKAHRDSSFAHAFVTDKPTEAIFFSATTGSNAVNFPLWIYPESGAFDAAPHANFQPELLQRLKGLATHPVKGEPDPVAVFDYVYGVLHSPSYREDYAEFLKTDFPRIPWPDSPDEFWNISESGARLRKLHLMDATAIGAAPYPFLGEGNGTVERYQFEEGKIWINSTQYFDSVPEHAWVLKVGGYQPAQKWLKDLKGHVLDFERVKTYQRILKILSETHRIARDIKMTTGAVDPDPLQ
ncbi:DNA methyltransferase [Paraburkholderia hospita]|uniref:site-specific DNA-methyltransferase (adenine-specific) n=1 Tax=Paraburkholderia hospita TaxID=169430 RepID=A0AAN1JL20_9BURK|nr:type ISP restriction/modification enzyme [Paraburkholderia hospita]AUT75720.1 DNA methyltransferase [Paraburkholderia hospita]